MKIHMCNFEKFLLHDFKTMKKVWWYIHPIFQCLTLFQKQTTHLYLKATTTSSKLTSTRSQKRKMSRKRNPPVERKQSKEEKWTGPPTTETKDSSTQFKCKQNYYVFHRAPPQPGNKFCKSTFLTTEPR